jgi:hypothetical protein
MVGSGARLKVGNGGTVKVGTGAKVGGGANVNVGIGAKLMLGGGATGAAGAGPADWIGGVGKSSEIGGNEYATVGMGVERSVGTDAGALVTGVVVRATALGDGAWLATVELRVLGPSKAAAPITVDMLKRKTTTQPISAVERLADPSIGARVRTPRTSDIRKARPKPTAAIATKLLEPVDREPSRKKATRR